MNRLIAASVKTIGLAPGLLKRFSDIPTQNGQGFMHLAVAEAQVVAQKDHPLLH